MTGISAIGSAKMTRPTKPPSTSERSSADGLPSPAAGAAVDVLVALSVAFDRPVSLRELANHLGVRRSTLHRILQTLEVRRMVEHVPEAGYVLGDGVRVLGLRARVPELTELARPVIREMYEKTRETINFAIPQERGMLIVAAAESEEPLRMVSAVGKRDLYHASALGKAYLAALPEDRARMIVSASSLVSMTPNTHTSVDAVLSEVAATHERGYSIDDQESVAGVRCVGAAVLLGDADPVAALSISGPAARVAGDALKEAASEVVSAAVRLSELARAMLA